MRMSRQTAIQNHSDTLTMPARSARNVPDRSDKDIGRRLAMVRTLAKLTQDEMAESLGVTQGTYSAWETGGRHLGLNSAHAICDVYDVTLDWLYRGHMGGLPFEKEGVLRKMKLGR